MSEKLIEALKVVEEELRTLSLKDFEKVCAECNKNIPRAIDLILLFVNTVIQQRSKDDGDVLSLILPIESKQQLEHPVQTSQEHQYTHSLLKAIKDKEALKIKQPCLYTIETDHPIEGLTPHSQFDVEDLPPVLFVPKSSIETLIQDLNRLGHNFTELDVGEEDVLCYTIEGKSPNLQLNICENFIEIYVGYTSVYYKEYNSNSVDEIDKFLSRV